MFENFLKPKQEDKQEKETPSPEVLDFRSEEENLLKKSEGFLMALAPEKYKHKAASALTALSLFAVASSAFAEGPSPSSSFGMYLDPALQEARARVAQEPSSFDWKGLSKKIQISVGTYEDGAKPFTGEEINSLWSTNNSFYQGLGSLERSNAWSAGEKAAFSATDASQFLNNIHNFSPEGSQPLPETERLMMLQSFGSLLSSTYNMDMLNSNTHVEVSPDAMFKALQEQYSGIQATTGICGNIHTALTEYAQALGFESWLQTGATEGGFMCGRG